MLLGARQFFEKRGGGGWTNPYVTEGLVAMWDGEWNAGGGTSSSDNEAVDLSGNGHDGVFWGGMVKADNYFWTPVSSAVGALYTTVSEAERAALAENCTAEIVVRACDSADFSYNSLYHRFVSVAGMLTSGMFVNGNLAYGPRYWAGLGFNAGGFGALFALRLQSVGTAATISASNGNSSSWTVSNTEQSYLAGFCGSAATPSTTAYAEKGAKFHSFRLYSRALTASEIAANYSVDKERFDLP